MLGRIRRRRVEYQIDLQTTRVHQDRHRLGPNRAGGFFKPEQGVEGNRTFQVMHADADVG